MSLRKANDITPLRLCVGRALGRGEGDIMVGMGGIKWVGDVKVREMSVLR